MNKYPYFISGSAPLDYPTESFFGNLMWSEDDGISVPYCCPFADEWGRPVSIHIYDEKEFPIPSNLDMIWLSLVENKFYSIEKRIPSDELDRLFQLKDETTGKSLYNYIIVGMAPYGRIAMWVHGDNKANLVSWLEAEEIEVEMEDFCPSTNLSRSDYVAMMLGSVPEAVENLKRNGLPPLNLFDKYMQQFNYRYQVIFAKWNDGEEKWEEYGEEEIIPELESLEEMLYDGTHDKLNDGGLLKYHDAGKPKKLALKWHEEKREYAAYLWFIDEQIKAVFDRFYGAHPETKTDFIIHMDPKHNKYRIELYRSGLKEPYVMSEDVYEMIVFRNKFEVFRSDNYSQKRGAWIW